MTMNAYHLHTETDQSARIASLECINRQLRSELSELRCHYYSLLRIPFWSDVNGKHREADDDVVHAAADWLIDRHMAEFERLVAELQADADKERADD